MEHLQKVPFMTFLSSALLTLLIMFASSLTSDLMTVDAKYLS
jgi:hypothetical protein